MKRKLLFIIPWCLFFITFIMCIYTVNRAGLIHTVLAKLSIINEEPVYSDEYHSWSNCLEQLNISCDIAFIGDSITANGNFSEYFSELSVCNLGCYGDTIVDLESRVEQLSAVSPSKVFIMIGTNSLGCRTLKQCEQEYSEMIYLISSTVPSADLYFLSVLPVSDSAILGARNNRNICIFNQFIQNTVEDMGYTYIDLYSAYVVNGALNPSMTSDGLHITSYDLWVDSIEQYIN